MSSTFYMGVIVPAAITLPLCAAVARYRFWQQPERLVFVFLLLSAIFNVLAKVTSASRINNLPMLHLYTVIEFCVLMAVFRSMFAHDGMRRLLIAAMCVFPVLALLYIWQTDSLFSYNVLPRFLSSIVLTGLCLYYLFRDLSRPAELRPVFNLFIVVGLLLYFSGASALFGLSESIRKDRVLNTVIWNIHATFVLIMYIIFGIGYLKLRKKE